MKILILLLLISCSRETAEKQKEREEKLDNVPTTEIIGKYGQFARIHRFIDKEKNKVCYLSNESISCTNL